MGREITIRERNSFNYHSYMAKMVKYNPDEKKLILNLSQLLINRETKLAIVMLLYEGKQNTSSIARELGTGKSRTYTHLEDLVRKRIARKEGAEGTKNITYYLNPLLRRPDLEKWIDMCIEMTYDSKAADKS